MTVDGSVVDMKACVLTFMEGDVAHVHFKEHRTVEREDVLSMFEVIEARRNGRKVLLLVTVGEGTYMSNEARVEASAGNSGRLIAADAIVVRDFGHQLAANVFVRHHKPDRPIRMFPDKDSAMAWLAQQRNLIDPS